MQSIHPTLSQHLFNPKEEGYQKKTVRNNQNIHTAQRDYNANHNNQDISQGQQEINHIPEESLQTKDETHRQGIMEP